jgi:hypothetical protein
MIRAVDKLGQEGLDPSKRFQLTAESLRGKAQKPQLKHRTLARQGHPKMKNQYFGDTNDFRKYGLLRILQSRGNGRLLIAWMLTPDDGSRDGGFRSYLQDPGAWVRYAPSSSPALLVCFDRHPCPKCRSSRGLRCCPGRPIIRQWSPTRAERDAWRIQAQMIRAALIIRGVNGMIEKHVLTICMWDR